MRGPERPPCSRRGCPTDLGSGTMPFPVLLSSPFLMMPNRLLVSLATADVFRELSMGSFLHPRSWLYPALDLSGLKGCNLSTKRISCMQRLADFRISPVQISPDKPRGWSGLCQAFGERCPNRGVRPHDTEANRSHPMPGSLLILPGVCSDQREQSPPWASGRDALSPQECWCHCSSCSHLRGYEGRWEKPRRLCTLPAGQRGESLHGP